ncbi:remorin 1.4-like [Henckelia pumila]|uniref:remorin 1.4-like n=1 Tax=Henckelia pumila TaxID=405737 RepID=UPI003C6E2B15
MASGGSEAAAMEKPNQYHPVVEEVQEPAVSKQVSKAGSLDRDIALAKLEDQKKLSNIKAWEENEKSKVDNNAQKKVCEIASWENTKKASLEAQLRKLEEKLEKKKAEYAERVKNKVALVHKEAEEKRAMVEAKRGEEILKAQEMAAKYRATGHTPTKAFACFSP